MFLTSARYSQAIQDSLKGRLDLKDNQRTSSSIGCADIRRRVKFENRASKTQMESSGRSDSIQSLEWFTNELKIQQRSLLLEFIFKLINIFSIHFSFSEKFPFKERTPIKVN